MQLQFILPGTDIFGANLIQLRQNYRAAISQRRSCQKYPNLK